MKTTLKNWLETHHFITGFKITKQINIDSSLRRKYVKRERNLTPLL